MLDEISADFPKHLRIIVLPSLFRHFSFSPRVGDTLCAAADRFLLQEMPLPACVLIFNVSLTGYKVD